MGLRSHREDPGRRAEKRNLGVISGMCVCRAAQWMYLVFVIKRLNLGQCPPERDPPRWVGQQPEAQPLSQAVSWPSLPLPAGHLQGFQHKHPSLDGRLTQFLLLRDSRGSRRCGQLSASISTLRSPWGGGGGKTGWAPSCHPRAPPWAGGWASIFPAPADICALFSPAAPYPTRFSQYTKASPGGKEVGLGGRQVAFMTLSN